MRTQSIAITLGAALGAVLLHLAAPGGAAAQPVFDNMKCYKIKDGLQPPKQFTSDLVPKVTHDFQTELGDRIVGGFLKKGCRIKTPAKFFCIDVAAENAHDVKPPYDPTQWVVPGPESGERLCYKLICPPVPPQELAVIDAFGNRVIQLRGRTDYFCTPVVRQSPSTDPCDMAGNGQCGGTCADGQVCLATSPSGCGCVPPEQACAVSQSCGDGFCGGVWETCVSLPGDICGCSHPPG